MCLMGKFLLLLVAVVAGVFLLGGMDRIAADIANSIGRTDEGPMIQALLWIVLPFGLLAAFIQLWDGTDDTD